MAYLTFLELYNNAIIQARQDIALIHDRITLTNFEINVTDIQAMIAEAQQQIAINGMDSDVVQFLTGLGLSEARIMEVQNEFMDFRYSPNGDLAYNFRELLTGLDAVSISSNIPTPGTLPLIAVAVVLLTLLRKRASKWFRRRERLAWNHAFSLTLAAYVCAVQQLALCQLDS